MPTVSVIVPVYKVEPFLHECVESILAQSFTDYELILVDDGSPDSCPAMCDAWAAKDPRIKVVHKPNGGLSDARNAGLVIAQGEYISFVDSDDWIAPEMLEKLLEAMQRDDSDIAACSVQMVWEDGKEGQLLTVQTNCVLEREEAEHALMAEVVLKQPVWYKLYRRDCIRGISFEVGKQHEDVFWSYLAVANARRVSVIDYVGYYYRQRPGSIMSTSYSLKRLDAIEAYEKRSRFMEAHFPALADEARTQVLTGCIYHGQMALKYLPESEREEAFRRLEDVFRRNRVSRAAYAHRKFTARMWLAMAKVSLRATCRIKTALGVGF